MIDNNATTARLIEVMRSQKLEPGQMLLLGPLSVAYITGDYVRAPWVIQSVKPPDGKRLPDKHILEKEEWYAGETWSDQPAAPHKRRRTK